MIKPYCVPVPGAEMIRECYHAGVWWDDLNEFRDNGFFFLFKSNALQPYTIYNKSFGV